MHLGQHVDHFGKRSSAQQEAPAVGQVRRGGSAAARRRRWPGRARPLARACGRRRSWRLQPEGSEPAEGRRRSGRGRLRGLGGGRGVGRGVCAGDRAPGSGRERPAPTGSLPPHRPARPDEDSGRISSSSPFAERVRKISRPAYFTGSQVHVWPNGVNSSSCGSRPSWFRQQGRRSCCRCGSEPGHVSRTGLGGACCCGRLRRLRCGLPPPEPRCGIASVCCAAALLVVGQLVHGLVNLLAVPFQKRSPRY